MKESEDDWPSSGYDRSLSRGSLGLRQGYTERRDKISLASVEAEIKELESELSANVTRETRTRHRLGGSGLAEDQLEAAEDSGEWIERDWRSARSS